MSNNNLPRLNKQHPVLIAPPYIVQAGIVMDKSLVQTMDKEHTGILMQMENEYGQPVYNIMFWGKDETDGEDIQIAWDVEPDTELIVLAHSEDFMMNMLLKFGYEPGLGTSGKTIEILIPTPK